MMNRSLRYISLIVLMTVTASLMQSCSKKDSNPVQPEQPSTHEGTMFDDLRYFQNSIVSVDSLGNFMYRAFGEPLNADDTARLFIGVESLDEAERFFRYWIAPDVTVSEDQGELICPLTDVDGNAQGIVYFRPADDGSDIAEVTASDETHLLYFNRITFIHNADWPNTVVGPKWSKFDIVHSLDISIKDVLWSDDSSLNWVCVRESGNGVKPMFCALTYAYYDCLDESGTSEDWRHERIRESKYCPAMSTAQNIGYDLQADWDLFGEVFKEATGTDSFTTHYWIDDTHTEWVFITYYELFYYKDNTHYGEDDGSFPFLLKIDWLDDDQIYDGAVIN